MRFTPQFKIGEKLQESQLPKVGDAVFEEGSTAYIESIFEDPSALYDFSSEGFLATRAQITTLCASIIEYGLDDLSALFPDATIDSVKDQEKYKKMKEVLERIVFTLHILDLKSEARYTQARGTGGIGATHKAQARVAFKERIRVLFQAKRGDLEYGVDLGKLEASIV